MSRTIDERVVEMRFDNKQFESGAKETISTLSRLKEALKIQSNVKDIKINKPVKSASMDGLISGVETLNKRFSTMGIVWMTVIQNITNAMLGKLNSAINTVKQSIISGGIKRAMNIENAHYQLQALLKDETKVQAIMADAMASVDGTAYAYDEAAKAASQFAATGIEAGQEMQDALKGITGVAAMTNSSFESISMIFTTVAGNGRLMGDQLLQLASRGLNAASTISNYFKEVRGQSDMTEQKVRELVTKGQISFKDFSEAMTWAFGDSAKRANETFTGAMANMKSALARIGAGFISPLVEQNGELVQLFNALRIKINDVKSALVFDEQRSAMAGLAKATGMTDEKLGKMFEKIKTNGNVTIKQLDKLNRNGADATGALTKYFNGVSDGSIRASYVVGKAVKDLTKGTEVSSKDIEKWTKKGKIDLQTFTAAMENEFGNEKAISKQFTDFVQDYVHKLTTAITKLDMTKPMEGFYDILGSVQNVLKGIFSVLKPIGEAFADVFLGLKMNEVLDFTSSIEKLTSKMKVSKESSKNLHDAFEGLFNIAKIIIDAIIGLGAGVLSILSPFAGLIDIVISLLSVFGRFLTGITKIIKSNKILKTSFGIIHLVLSNITKGIMAAIKAITSFVDSITKLAGTSKLVDALYGAFKKLSGHIGGFIEDVVVALENLLKRLFDLDDLNIHTVLDNISKSFSDLAKNIEKFSFGSIDDAITSFMKKLDEIKKMPAKNFNNVKATGDNLRKALSFDDIMGRMKKIMSVFGEFFNWFKDSLGPAFEGLNVGSLLATGGGFGMLYALIKGINAFNKMGGHFQSVFKSLSGALDAVKNTLTAYQKELNASALIKVAGAIAIIAGALVLLSFVDTKRLIGAATALGIVSGIILYGMTKLKNALNQGNDAFSAIETFAEGVNKMLRDFGKARKYKAIGSVIKSIGQTFAMIAGSIIALGLLYKKDKGAFDAGADAVKKIAIVMIGSVVGMTLLGSVMSKGMKGFATAAFGVLALSFSLSLIVNAMKKVFKLEIPKDWENKLKILKKLFGYLGGLVIAVGLAGRIAGGKFSSSATIVSMAIFLYTTVSALGKLFKMKIPEDGNKKILILMGIFKALGALMLVISVSSRLAGGSIKAAGTILALSVFLGAVVGALMFLAIVPFEKLIKGAAALGIVLFGLGAALYGAGKIKSKDAQKAILSMTFTLAAITAALGVLSIIPFGKLLKSVVALGSVLLILGNTFKQVSKVVDKKAWLTITAMVIAVAGITASLYILSSRPWGDLLSAAVSLGGVLLALSGAFNIFSKTKELNPTKVAMFLLATTSLIPIVTALYILSKQPMEQMISSAIALSGVVLALSGAFAIISMTKPDLTAMMSFVAAAASVGLIVLAINKLAQNPWENLLATTAGLSAVILSLSAAMGICAIAGNFGAAALVGIGILDLFLLNMLLVMAALGKIFKSEGAKQLIANGSEVLTMIAQSIGNFVGAIVNGALKGISDAMPQMATDLSDFMTNLKPFIDGTKGINPETVQACKNIAGMVLALTASQFIAGISKFLGLGGTLSDFGMELIKFGPRMKLFGETVKDIKPEAVKGAAAAAEMMATVAKKLPAQGGWVQKVFGERSLADFGMELIKFGPRIKLFGEVVKDVKPAAVQGAASAAEIMATVAKKLPAQGGYVQKIFGERSLAEFGTELTKFGPKIVMFSHLVKNVNPSSVAGVSAATSIMSILANKLPKSETLLDKIFGGGQYSLSDFGKELISFGKSMSSFSSSLGNFSSEKVNASITSFGRIINMANGIGENSASKLLSFTETLSQIGTDGVNNFVNAFANAGPSIQVTINKMCSIVTASLTGKIPTFQSSGLRIGKSIGIGINTGIANSKSIVISSLSSLTTLIGNKVKNSFKTSLFVPYGRNVIQGVINGINDRKSGLTATANSICLILTNKFKNSLSLTALRPVGQNTIQGIINGVNGNKPILLSAITAICNNVINKFKSGLPSSTFRTLGRDIVTWLINGINNKKSSAEKSIDKVCSAIKRACKNNLKKSDFENIGKNVGAGLVKGIESKIDDVERAAARMARAASKASKVSLKEKSPSKVFYEIGEYVALGLANGITDYIRVVERASKNLSKASINNVEGVVKDTSFAIGNMDFYNNPVIRPVVDLSDVYSAANKIPSTFSGLDLSTTLGLARSISNDFLGNNLKNEMKDSYNRSVKKALDNFIKSDGNPSKIETNTFYIQSTDPKQAAEEIGYIMQHKVERGKAAWAK